MGLDMYLNAKTYISGYGFDSSEETAKYSEAIILAGLEGVADPQTPAVYVETTVCYWRKANAIHNWFVTNVQDGVDECQYTPVRRELLEELIAVCKEALKAYDSGDHDKVVEILPPISGFFFGGTDIDEWYVTDLKHTIETLRKVLDAPGSDYLEFYYHSSW